jgi:NAD(P)-dependent dehydrogenase (short-subunit alcohol dehydrogenase family)
VLVSGLRFFITGGASGIGAGTAKVVARHGGIPTICDVDDGLGGQVVDQIKADGGQALYLHCDITDGDEIAGAMAKSAEAFGGIDVLHNNAGVHDARLFPDSSLDALTADDFRKVLEVNLVGPWVCSKIALPYLRRSANASIINSGSVASIVGYPLGICYGASKGGIDLLTKNLAVALAPDRIRVNCYCPGAVRTPLAETYIEQIGLDAFVRMNTATNLVPRMGVPEDVGNLVCFLASDMSSYINGVTYVIDGGALAWRGTLDQIGMEPEGIR